MMGNKKKKKKKKNQECTPSVGTCALICYSSQSVRKGVRREGVKDRWMDKRNFRRRRLGMERERKKRKTGKEEEDFKVLRSLLNTVLMCFAYS